MDEKRLAVNEFLCFDIHQVAFSEVSLTLLATVVAVMVGKLVEGDRVCCLKHCPVTNALL